MSLNSTLAPLLADVGLSEAEITLYLELLREPAENIFSLVSRTGLSKSSAYRAFDKLRHLHAVKHGRDGISVRSLTYLVAELQKKERGLRKSILKLKHAAPFLHAGRDDTEVFETLHTPSQLHDAYLFMSDIDYETNFDFGDFESFIPLIGGVETGDEFRKNRLKHAQHRAICTTFGPSTEHFCTREATNRFRTRIDILNIDFRNRFIIFSDTNDYVLFANVCDRENPYGVLVKSRSIADAQRVQYNAHSQRIGNE
ncbi:MAG: helix-turn-helix domain-containing protein [Candidatus Peribacteraceae bacterium]|nr:helix-turn-helix domain-containing protein [Candidatus Peribacteraceae bacterium]MDD5742349.1 helix-turn-helix domain-containing protein [Candidatus Peribacteraceae bacterium]